jgi:hypothetical protein
MHKAFNFLLALALIVLASCSAPPPGAGSAADAAADAAAATVDAAAASTATGADGLAWCAIVEERLPPAECALLSAVPRGTGAFKAPERMKRGDSETVILAISREANSSAPSEAIARAEGREGTFRPAVGRYIEAKLLPEPGLKVEPDPATPELQDLYASTESLWRWTVTAEAAGEHQLTLRTRVMVKLPDGSFAPRGQPFVDSRQIAVYVEGADAIVDGTKEADKAIDALSGTTGNLTKLIGAVTALVVAVGGLWLAFRRFGKPKADDKPDEGAGSWGDGGDGGGGGGGGD